MVTRWNNKSDLPLPNDDWDSQTRPVTSLDLNASRCGITEKRRILVRDSRSTAKGELSVYTYKIITVTRRKKKLRTSIFVTKSVDYKMGCVDQTCLGQETWSWHAKECRFIFSNFLNCFSCLWEVAEFLHVCLRTWVFRALIVNVTSYYKTMHHDCVFCVIHLSHIDCRTRESDWLGI